MEEDKHIIEYKGNDEEFQKYENIIDRPIKNTIIIKSEKNIKQYEGNIKNNVYEGRGIIYDESGNIIYKGYFREGKYEGYGQQYSDKNLIYKGFFHDGKYNGKGNLYENGSKKYEGNFYEGEYNGVGIFYVNGEKVSKRLYKNGCFLSKGFVIFYDKNKEIYSGISSDYKPKQGKNLTIYDGKGYKIYKGDFLDFNYNGQGILYFNQNNNIYFSGKFENNNFVNGKLYDLDGKITYEGTFINNIPVEGKNIKIYKLKYNSLVYEGDIVNCKYNGKGKLYNDGYLLYDGEFKDGIYNGKGKLYKGNYKNVLIFDGEFKDGIFNGFGKIYNEEYLYYEGNFINNEIFGNGIKYYKNGKKHIQGDFIFKNKNQKIDFEFSKKYAKGILYDLSGDILCETEIIDFIPKEGKNVKIYYNDEYLIYEGDFLDYKYHGIGKLYTEDLEYNSSDKNNFVLLYEGGFKQNLYEGYGKLYKEFYENLYYEGNFINGVIKGKGIRYYKNGLKKLEGIFGDNNIFEGVYYNPKGKIIFKGKIANDIFCDTSYIELYNDNGFLLYKNKIKIINNINEIYENLELLNNVILCRRKTLNYIFNSKKLNNKAEKITKISFVSEGYAGMTSLVKRFMDNIFLDLNPPIRYGPDYKGGYNYSYENIVYKMKIWILHGNSRYHNFKVFHLIQSDIIVYVVDISINDNNINELFINNLFVNCKKSFKCIYLVLTKIDISKKDLNQFRKIAQKLILEGMIYRYFEVSSKTGEGIESFRECLNFDNIFISNSEFEKDEKTDKYKNIPSLVLEDHMNNKETGRKNIHKKLNKYLNY